MVPDSSTGFALSRVISEVGGVSVESEVGAVSSGVSSGARSVFDGVAVVVVDFNFLAIALKIGSISILWGLRLGGGLVSSCPPPPAITADGYKNKIKGLIFKKNLN